jgi:hypothetical protein
MAHWDPHRRRIAYYCTATAGRTFAVIWMSPAAADLRARGDLALCLVLVRH